jgi:hypothetical protein
MIRFQRIFFILLLLLSAAGHELSAQDLPVDKKVDPTLRRRTEIDGNNVRTSVFNYVFSGRTGAGQGVPYEFPKNTGRFYVALVALFVGGEVVDNTGETIRVVDLPAFRRNPSTGADWNMGPIPGFFDPVVGRIAKSDEPDTWPDQWPDKLTDSLDPGWSGSWNGFFGKNQFNADQEVFYRAGDDNYDRWNYSPDENYPDRRGLGMLIDARILEWSQVSVADAVFFIQAVKNDGTKPIKKTAVTLWLADFVGGDGDSQDDAPTFDLIADIAYSLDFDGLSSNPAFQGECVGAAATLYLETPGNAVDRIDNDGDADSVIYELGGPRVLGSLFEARLPGTVAEISGDQIDNNLNGLIDEDSTHIPFGDQVGVGFADYIDNDADGEESSPVVTSSMVSQATLDVWGRWPANPETDALQDSIIHLLQVDTPDEGMKYKDNIDNNGDANSNLPAVTQEIVDAAASDPLKRYRVPGTNVILYDVGSEDIGRKYIDRDGYRDPHVDENIDEMSDESRNDGIDNDGDWDAATDDLGLDGAEATGDFGEDDGLPTSGVGTEFPGEPNIDKTDVSEADQIGLTNVQYLAAGAINFETTPDIFFWTNFMLPGRFVDPALIPIPGEFDLFVSSGVFPMQPGQIEQISYAVVFGNANTCPGRATATGAKADADRKKDAAQIAYNEDYQFAQAPAEPTVTAVAGARLVDGVWQPQVTLYWDEISEESVDRFLSGIVGSPVKDFEGYKIYRATDAAFEDARTITDGYGNPAPWLNPVVTFDLKDGIRDFHPADFNGVRFFMGNDVGLVHSYVDTAVRFGQEYYYAVRAFDQGYTGVTPSGLFLNITPSESNLKISVDNITGKVTSKGTSVAIVKPEAPVAGYVGPEVSNIALVEGTTTGTIDYTVIDPTQILNNHKYRITFEDTVLQGTANTPDTFKTKNFTLADITDPAAFDTLIRQSTALEDTNEQPLTDGFRLILRNEKNFGLNAALSGWNNLGVYNYLFNQWKFGFDIGQQKPSDYLIVFSDQPDLDTSTTFRTGSTTWPAIPVNFKVFNTSEGRQIDFGFVELDQTDGRGNFTARIFNRLPQTDRIIFLEPNTSDSLVSTWAVGMTFDSLFRRPVGGDSLVVTLSKLFRSSDVFEFTTIAQSVDPALAKNELSKIKVVPNPYVAAATWEPKNPFTSGRGPRSLHFTHLPQKCTIRIFTVSGELVKTIEHDSNALDGTAEWDLLTRDNLTVSYGIYIYHVDAGELGEIVGKFAVIK